MQKMIKPLFHSVFFRLVLTFLFILIPIVASSLWILSWGKQAIEREIIGSLGSHMVYLKRGLEDEISRVKDLESALVNDPDLNQLISEY